MRLEIYDKMSHLIAYQSGRNYVQYNIKSTVLSTIYLCAQAICGTKIRWLPD